MRPKSIVLLVLALGCGLVAAVGINQALAKRREHAAAPTMPTDTILVAMSDIDMGSTITPELVRLEEWPKDKVPAGAVKDLADATDRRTRTKLYAGEPILEAKLLSPGAGDGATGLIPKGMRVVSVQVDAVSGGSSLILPGDRVDMLVYLRESQVQGVAATSTRTILQDIKVFAVNDVFHREARDKDETSITAKTISLLVTPEQAEVVSLATELGRVRLVMRGREDEGVATTPGALASQLVGSDGKGERDNESLMDMGEIAPAGQDLLSLLNKKQQAPQPAPVAVAASTPGTWRMLVIKGKDVEQVEFQD